MKQKLSFILAGLLALSVMAGCTAQAKSKETAYISKDNARAAALTAAGVEAGSASMTAIELSEHDGIPYYEVNFTAAGIPYSYSVDAVTGVVIEAQNEAPSNHDSSVTDDDTLAPAVAKDGTAVTDYDTVSTKGAVSGTVSNGSAPTPPSPPAQTPSAGANGEITLEQAKQAALKHAGKTGANVTFVKAHKDLEDGRSVYEIEFVVQSGNSVQEYDYEISAATGKVLSFDYDAESYAPKKQDSAAKTKDEVRKIALAKVPGATASDCSLQLDEEDGRLVYEGKIVYNGMEYEFEIDAYSGTILDWEAESIDD